MRYDHQKIERKWQKFWQDHKTFKTDIDSNKPKYYVLDMFPFPSGAGLHVGHLVGYTATDIVARYKRQRGYNVLHPMGWDSFGLPAEQYAVRTGTHPAITTQKNIDTYRRQLKSAGFSYDWDREITTSNPDYYKWTQWIFTKLYEKGLAYEAEVSVNYCPALGTVLANEEIENGRSKVGGHPIVRRPLRQWMLKITAYADRLIEDLKLVDWPESLKKLQMNWIGKSEGAQIDFPIEGFDQRITVFTTRSDTIYGATFLVLAPEHPLISSITPPNYRSAVKKYQEDSSAKSDLDRTDLAKVKTGVFTGAYAINPATEKKIPIWVADYVLMGYGTGAIMSVPGNDERDFEFASQYQLPIISVEEYGLNHLTEEEAKQHIIQWLQSKGLGKSTVSYKLRDWLFSRQRYWGEPFPILHFEDGTKRVMDLDELPLCLPDVTNYEPSGDGQSPLAKVSDWIHIIDPKTGKKAKRETNTMPNWAGSCWYFLRFCDPHNACEAWSKESERYWGAVDLYVGGAEHAVLHLLYARFWHKVLYDCGYVSTPEPFLTLRNQGLVISRSFQTANGLYVDAEDVIEKEGVYIHRHTQEKLRTQFEKMSKSKLNGVAPDEIFEEFGADALRLYEMFMGPLDKEKIWNSDAVTGCSRFLTRFYEMATSSKVTEETTEEALKLGYRLVHGVTQDIEALQFNTAIAKMMEFINEFTKLSHYPRKVIKMATQVLMPFAPHLAEELWEFLKFPEPINTYPYPVVDAKYLEDQTVTYVVQVNGKVRGRFELPKDQSQEKIFEAAKQLPSIQRYLDNQVIEKVVFVPNKLLSIVTSNVS